MRYFPLLGLLLCSLLIAGCAADDEGKIGKVVDDLVSALDDHDTAAAAALYVDGSVARTTNSGDSSTIYRMLVMPKAEDFDADLLDVSIIEDYAKAIFILTGDFPTAEGTTEQMQVKLTLDMIRLDDTWRIMPGGEALEPVL